MHAAIASDRSTRYLTSKLARSPWPRLLEAVPRCPNQKSISSPPVSIDKAILAICASRRRMSHWQVRSQQNVAQLLPVGNTSADRAAACLAVSFCASCAPHRAPTEIETILTADTRSLRLSTIGRSPHSIILPFPLGLPAIHRIRRALLRRLRIRWPPNGAPCHPTNG